jgi:hypothetical protein
MTAWEKSELWLERHPFSASLLLAAAGGTAVSLTTPAPATLPVVALESIALYKLEVMAGAYVIFYVLLTSFFLSLSGRGFVKMGPGGIQAGPVLLTKQQLTLQKQTKAINVLRRNLDRNTALTQVANQELREEIEAVNRRVDKLDDAS